MSGEYEIHFWNRDGSILVETLALHNPTERYIRKMRVKPSKYSPLTEVTPTAYLDDSIETITYEVMRPSIRVGRVERLVAVER